MEKIVAGDAKLESEGQADKVEGKIQNAIGSLKDALKGKWRSPLVAVFCESNGFVQWKPSAFRCGNRVRNFLP